MKPAPRPRWDSDRWAAVERRFPRTAKLLEPAYIVPHIGDLVRALFLDRLDDAHEDGRSVGYVAHELGIGRRTAWRWILEMERESQSQSAPAETRRKPENAGQGDIAKAVPDRQLRTGKET